MLKLILCCDLKSRNMIKLALSQYFKHKKMEYDLKYTGSYSKLLDNYFFNKDIKLLIIYKNHQLSYLLKTYNNFAKNYVHMVSGLLEFPLNFVEIKDKLFKSAENAIQCPYGVYNVKSGSGFHKILHKDIEYIERVNRHSIIHLRNGETEEITASINKIQEEINEKYFVKCAKGYLVSIFHVKKAHRHLSIIELNSGTKIPLTRTSFRQFLSAYIETASGFNIFKE